MPGEYFKMLLALVFEVKVGGTELAIGCFIMLLALVFDVRFG